MCTRGGSEWKGEGSRVLGASSGARRSSSGSAGGSSGVRGATSGRNRATSRGLGGTSQAKGRTSEAHRATSMSLGATSMATGATSGVLGRTSGAFGASSGTFGPSCGALGASSGASDRAMARTRAGSQCISRASVATRRARWSAGGSSEIAGRRSRRKLRARGAAPREARPEVVVVGDAALLRVLAVADAHRVVRRAVGLHARHDGEARRVVRAHGVRRAAARGDARRAVRVGRIERLPRRAARRVGAAGAARVVARVAAVRAAAGAASADVSAGATGVFDRRAVAELGRLRRRPLAARSRREPDAQRHEQSATPHALIITPSTANAQFPAGPAGAGLLALALAGAHRAARGE
jgi:hypothetical protein